MAQDTITQASNMEQLREPKNFLQEENHDYSAIRLMSFVALIASIVFGAMTLTLNDSKSEGIYITFGFLLSAFAPKVVQKFAEDKVPPFTR